MLFTQFVDTDQHTQVIHQQSTYLIPSAFLRLHHTQVLFSAVAATKLRLLFKDMYAKMATDR